MGETKLQGYHRLCSLFNFDGTTVFYPFSDFPYRPPDLYADFKPYIKTKCIMPKEALSIEKMKEALSGFYADYLPQFLGALKQYALTLIKNLEIPEPFALALSHLYICSHHVERKDVRRHAVFLFARYLRESYTYFIQKIIEFDDWQQILSIPTRKLMTEYTFILSTEFDNQLPIW